MDWKSPKVAVQKSGNCIIKSKSGSEREREIEMLSLYCFSCFFFLFFQNDFFAIHEHNEHDKHDDRRFVARGKRKKKKTKINRIFMRLYFLMIVKTFLLLASSYKTMIRAEGYVN